jgi:hypothetical protein
MNPAGGGGSNNLVEARETGITLARNFRDAPREGLCMGSFERAIELPTVLVWQTARFCTARHRRQSTVLRAKGYRNRLVRTAVLT